MKKRLLCGWVDRGAGGWWQMRWSRSGDIRSHYGGSEKKKTKIDDHESILTGNIGARSVSGDIRQAL